MISSLKEPLRQKTAAKPRMGKFSSDRAIREYCQKIWEAAPVKVALQEYVQHAQ